MAERDVTRGFQDVDAVADPARFVRFLDDVGALEWIADLKRRSFLMMSAKPGSAVLDLGCGAGDDARALAQLVGPDGRVVGIDSSAAMIAEARKRSAGSELRVEFTEADAHTIPFADNSFDACHVDRVLQHVQDPARVVAELARVTRPGGRIVVHEQDWETHVIHPGEKPVTRAILLAFCDSIRNGWIGRQLTGLLADAGFTEVASRPELFTSRDLAVARKLWLDGALASVKQNGVVAEGDAERWMRGLEDASVAGRFVWAFTMFGAVGVAP